MARRQTIRFFQLLFNLTYSFAQPLFYSYFPHLFPFFPPFLIVTSSYFSSEFFLLFVSFFFFFLVCSLLLYFLVFRHLRLRGSNVVYFSMSRMMGSNKISRIHLVPLPKGSVLLPGVTLRIPVSNRPDVANLLNTLLDQSSSGRRDGNGSVVFGCVPFSSPLLSKDGQQLIEDKHLDDEEREVFDSIDAGQARKEDLFRYGTVGKVIGVQRRMFSEPSLVVQGVQRFKIKRILKERPYFEADAVLYEEKGVCFFFFLFLCVLAWVN